jgi:hypothetical protein
LYSLAVAGLSRQEDASGGPNSWRDCWVTVRVVRESMYQNNVRGIVMVCDVQSRHGDVAGSICNEGKAREKSAEQLLIAV